MKNGDLVIFGREANCFIPEFVEDREELSGFEFAAYRAYDEKYGSDACERDGMNSLADLFGQEFSDRLFKRRWKLLAKERLGEVIKEYLELQDKMVKLSKFIEKPTPKYEDIP